MIRTWQDFDENHRKTWGMWFGCRSVDGHIVEIVGPFERHYECVDKLEGTARCKVSS